MPHQAGEASNTLGLVLRLSVPAEGGLRLLATEVATRVAAYCGNGASAEAAGATLESLAERVAPKGADGEITFEFTRIEGGLLIRARCNGRSSEARHPLPA
jgi:hypothetical protein